MTVAGPEIVIASISEPAKIAESLIKHPGALGTPDGNAGIQLFRGTLFHFYAGRWHVLKQQKEGLRGLLWRVTSDMGRVSAIDGEGDPIDYERYKPRKAKVDELVDAVCAMAHTPHANMPAWLGGEQTSPEFSVAFDDVIVDIKASIEREEFVTVERKPEWFSNCIMPCEWQPEAQCPRWMQCLEEWSGGDENWAKLVQWWFGYCLMSSRKRAKWLLMHGKVRAGKGTIAHVMKLLVGESMRNRNLEDLTDSFGLDGLEYAKVLSISEVSDVGTKGAEKAVRVLKNIVGRDPLRINAKYRTAVDEVIVGAAPMMQANEIPNLPNKQRGLSVKMLVLPFGVSFYGKEQYDLWDVLESELAGIARWSVEGALELEAVDPNGEGWPHPEKAAEAVHEYHLMNNPFDQFLHATARQGQGLWVSNERVRQVWGEWCKMSGMENNIPFSQLSRQIVRLSSWDLELKKRGNTRGVSGMAFTGVYDVE